MKPIEILNTLMERRFNLLKEKNPADESEFKPLVDPENYDGMLFTRTNGQIAKVGKDDYLRYCIHLFIVNALAVKEQDILEGYDNALQKVTRKNSFGKTDDLILTSGTFNKQRQDLIRIMGPGEELAFGENIDVAQWSTSGTYLIVRNFEDFYKWYVKEFGEILYI